MSCCRRGIALKEEYANALKFEAITYGRLIAHKRNHEAKEQSPAMHHMQVVREAARRYTEGDVETHDEVPSTGSRELEI